VKAADIRDLTDAEVEDQLETTELELFRLRFRSATQELESTALIRTLRRDVARLKTIMRERGLIP
jgi:large subunit ribosomal protein L29